MKEIKLVILKLKMMIGLKCLSGELYLKALLEKIRKIKEVFMFDIEEGTATFIPLELS